MRRFVAIAALTVAVALLAPATSPLDRLELIHDGGSESQFVSSINGERSGRGLPSLAVHGPIAGTSCEWNHEMTASQTLAHDPNLVSDANRAEPNWQRVGENVGVGASVSQLHGAFMDSPGHRSNILDSGYTHIGVCVDFSSDGRMWTTHRFLQLPSSQPPPPPAPPPTTSPPPPPTTAAPPPPPTTQAPTTTASSTTTEAPTTTTTSSTTTSTTTTTEPPTTTESTTGDIEVAIETDAGSSGASPLVVGVGLAAVVGLSAGAWAVGRRRDA